MTDLRINSFNRVPPAMHIMRALNLHDLPTSGAEVLGNRRFNDLSITTIRVPARLDPKRSPVGLEVLHNELCNNCESGSAVFDLLNNQKGELIAVFNRKTQWSATGFFNFSHFYGNIPQAGEPNSVSEWQTHIKNTLADQRLIREYKLSVFGSHADDINEVTSISTEIKPYCFLEIDKSTGEWNAFAFSYRQFRYALTVLPNPDKHQIIIPVFPTVYNPGFAYLIDLDGEYYSSIYNDTNLKSDTSVLVIGPGSGTDIWIASKKTKEPIYSIGINPLEIANLRATADIGGFKTESIVGNNIVSEDGTLRFPGRTFDMVLWNMPEFSLKQRTFSILRSRWDCDYLGEDLIRFANALPSVLNPGGCAIVWNRLDKEVEFIFERAGLKCEIKPFDSDEGNGPHSIYRLTLK